MAEGTEVAKDAEIDEAGGLHYVIETQRLINAATLDTETVMKIVTERAQSITHADGGVVELAEGDDMDYRAVSGVATGSLGVRLALEGSLSGLCVREGSPCCARTPRPIPESIATPAGGSASAP
jgi:hypothetical protein